jgi:hypothetical protein
MLDFVMEELSATAGWRRVLEAYAMVASPAGASLPAGNEREIPESLGWVPRLSRLDGVEPDRLALLHGKLIALGLLSFEVLGKSGMQYQLSPLGRRTLDRGLGSHEALADEGVSSPAED